MPTLETEPKELTDIEKSRRWSAAIAKAIESFKRDGWIKVARNESVF